MKTYASLHQDANPIIDYMSSASLMHDLIWRLNGKSGIVNKECDKETITNLLYMSNKLWGLVSQIYIVVYVGADYQLMDSIKSNLEVNEASVRFVVIPYSDGGLICISNISLPFQSENNSAEWFFGSPMWS
jgi:hypothetical protein